MTEPKSTTATKAHVAGGIAALGAAAVTLLLFWAGPSIGLAAPDRADAASAFTVVVTTLVTAAATAIPTWIGAYFATNKPKGDVPMGGGLQAPPLAVLAAAGLALLLLGACAKDPATGAARTAGERATVALDYLTLAASLATVIAGEDPPDAVTIAAEGAEAGIATYCALPAWDKATVRRDLDPDVRAYVVARYGGADGDVCTDDLGET